jgi:hypothetical protein
LNVRTLNVRTFARWTIEGLPRSAEVRRRKKEKGRGSPFLLCPFSLFLLSIPEGRFSEEF